MYRMTILYGATEDLATFKHYYRTTHIPIAKKMKGLTGWNLTWIEPGLEEPSKYQLVADLYAGSAAAMNAIMASPEGTAASWKLNHD